MSALTPRKPFFITNKGKYSSSVEGPWGVVSLFLPLHPLCFPSYGLKVDIWAAGVITYILLCGFPPFRSENNLQEDLFDQILAGKLEFPAPYWDNITDSAKELISQMLQVNVEARCTAGEILSHPWVSDDASQENNMQAEVTGKLKQHFNNALPKQNSTTTGVSVIMVSGRHPVLLLESGSVWPDCSADIESLEVNSQGLSLTWKLAPSMFLFSLQDWLGTWSAPIWLTPGLESWGEGVVQDRPVGWARAPRSPWPLLPGSAPSLVAASAGISVSHLGRGSPAWVGLQSQTNSVR